MGKPPRTTSIGSCALAAAQISQFMKLDEMLVTSISHGGLSLAGSSPRLGAIVRVVADHDGVVPRHPDLSYIEHPVKILDEKKSD